MLLIECPWCGAREQTEFSHHGEAHIVRPAAPDSLSDEEWAAYLFSRKNPKGVHYERWMHVFGCRRYFHMARNTVSGEIYGVYPMEGEKPAAARAAETKQ
ncbi:MAG: sarcosine oxidase subunit delta [Betaproteobacteria bacterium]|nr:sarcosine oxidase subunit delta [Betaproteobacteria bacterium]